MKKPAYLKWFVEEKGVILDNGERDNTRAIHVYEKCGFREYNRIEEHVYMEVSR